MGKIKIFIYQNYLDGISNYFITNYRNYLYKNGIQLLQL